MKRIIKATTNVYANSNQTPFVNISEFIGLDKNQISDKLDSLDVGTKISGVRDKSGRYDFDKVIEKVSAYKQNMYNPVSSPNDWKYLDTYWKISGYENPYIVSEIYKIVNNESKYYTMNISDTVESAKNVLGYESFQDPLLEPPESDWTDVLDFSESIEVDIDAIINIDSDGDYEYDDPNYNWAKPDDESDVWRSNDGVNLGDEIDIVEHIDELLVDELPPIKPGKYKVTGTANLNFYITGLWVNENGDNFVEEADAMFSPKGSIIENLKLSPVE